MGRKRQIGGNCSLITIILPENRFMLRKIKYRLVFIYSLVLLYNGVKAQEAGSLFLLPAVVQGTYLNPAIQNKTDKLVIGLPFLSGNHFSWNANFPLDALFSNGLWNYSFHDFYDNLSVTGEGQASARLTMFYASLNYDEFSFSLSLSECAFGTTTFDREVVRLIRDGVRPYYGNDEYFGTGTANFTHYRELAFGISQRYWKELDIGIRPKILFGRTYFDAQDVGFSVETVNVNPNGEEPEEILHLKPEGTFSLTAPLEYTRDSVDDFIIFSNNARPGDYSFNFRNLGLALDIGAVFRPSEFYEFSASLLDFGFTSFKHNTMEVEFVDPVEYVEWSLYQSLDPDGDYYLEPREALMAFTDSVSYIIDVQDQKLRILEMLPFKINLSGKYNFTESFSAGLYNQFSFYGKHSLNVFSGFAQKRFRRTEVGANLSLYNITNVWLGLAAAYTGKHVQYYISTNNILGIIQPASSKHLNLSFGINFLFTTFREK